MSDSVSPAATAAPTAPTHRFRALAVVIALAVIALAVPLLDQPYYTKVVIRMAIFALAALSLDLIVGYGGLVSFGHAAFFGLGCYIAGVLPMAGVQHALLILPAAAIAAALVGFLTGALSLRASGLYFLFITLAFAQMLFHIAQGLRMLGADDGFRLPAATLLFGDVRLNQPVVLLYTSLGLLAAAWYLCRRITKSHFGQVVQAARDNPVKLRAVGLSPYPYRLALYTIAAALAGVAGALFANLTEFVTPLNMSWIMSGELLVMVILGGAGTLMGGIVGAVVFVALEILLSGWTDRWMFALGVLLVMRVMFLKEGLYGWLRK